MPAYGKWIAVLSFRLFGFGKYVLYSLWSRQRGMVSACDLPLYAFEYRPVLKEPKLDSYCDAGRERGSMTDGRHWGAGSLRVLPWGKKADASTPPIQGALLRWWAEHLNVHAVLELGTHRGVGTSYLARAASVERVWTIDANERALVQAQRLWDNLGVSHKIQAIHGCFQEVLGGVLRRMPSPQLVYMDGHHEGEATRRYFEIIAQHMPDGGWIIVDDIRWNRDMYRCWKGLCAHPRTKMAIDVGYMGIIQLQKVEDLPTPLAPIYWLPRPGWRWLFR